MPPSHKIGGKRCAVGRKRSSDLLSFEEVGRRGGGASRANPSLSRLAIFNAWSQAVGPTLRTVTSPSDCQRGRLVIDVSSAVWIAELERLRTEILEGLARLLPAGSVTSISYRLRPGVANPTRAARTAGARGGTAVPHPAVTSDRTVQYPPQ